MKKFFIPLIALLSILLISLVVLWFNFPIIIANIASKEFSVPVSIRNISLSKNNLVIDNFEIGNQAQAKTKNSFSSKKIDVKSSLRKIRSNPMTIDSITLDENIINIEFYNETGSKNNWTKMLSTPTKPNKDSKRKYLIKKLTLNNISVVLFKENGQKQTFPTIDKLEFYNISEKTGFPIEELEKAIAHEILKSTLKKLNLMHLLDQMPPVNLMKKVIPIKL
ncbi:MAG: hypothetical protein WCT85_01290 [Parachlamydiales bacterium]